MEKRNELEGKSLLFVYKKENKWNTIIERRNLMVSFYRCRNCGNLISKLNDTRVPVVCCGETMEELFPHTDTKSELGNKHMPVVLINGTTVEVKVGEVFHPMTGKHSINWIYLETKKGRQIKYLDLSLEPISIFALTEDDALINVYSYCNQHGLWLKTIEK